MPALHEFAERGYIRRAAHSLVASLSLGAGATSFLAKAIHHIHVFNHVGCTTTQAWSFQGSVVLSAAW